LKLVALAERESESFEKGIQLALQAVLVSPHFLFRGEFGREPMKPGTIYPLSDYELASRLSYFIWSSMPDEELFALAAKGRLQKNPAAQVKGMLRGPKSKALVENFAGQWLELRKLKTATPASKTFSDFDEKLRAAMQRETEMFFDAIVREDRSVL